MGAHKVIRQTALTVAIGQAFVGAEVSAASYSANNQASLINAISLANNTVAADIISITANITLNELSIGAENSLPIITTPITIDGNGFSLSRASGNSNDFRILQVADTASLHINDITISGGSTVNSGGAILAGEASTLTISDSTISHNSSAGLGGAISVGGFAGDSDTSYLTIDASQISHNSATRGGAIASLTSEVDISGTTLTYNYASRAGGAMSFLNYIGNGAAKTTLTLENSSISSNSAFRDGGGLEFQTGFGATGADASSLVVLNSTIDDNTAGLTGSPGYTGRGGGVLSYGASPRIEDSTIVNNYARNRGGGWLIRDGRLTLINSNVSSNTAEQGSGGGISLSSNIQIGLHAVIDSTLANNRAYRGAGLYSSAGFLQIRRTTLSANSATDTGGAIQSRGSDLEFHDSTVSNNFAGVDGGGIYFDREAGGDLKLRFTTITGNRVNPSGGGVDAAGGVKLRPFTAAMTFDFENSIIANSTGGVDCKVQANTVVLNSEFNLVEDGSCGVNTLTGDPLLGALRDNGGPTLTHLLIEESPLIDAADPNACFGTDQRSISRSPAPCNLGATEGFQKIDQGVFFVIPLPNGRMATIVL